VTFDAFMGRVGQAVDTVGVAVILVGLIVASGVALDRLRRGEPGIYSRYRRSLGRSILLGLELLVAGDIIRTVAGTPTLASVAVLGAIVAIRTFLSFSIELEVNWRWPWQLPSRGPRDGGPPSAVG
jgi:uncharacterized membrane protein